MMHLYGGNEKRAVRPQVCGLFVVTCLFVSLLLFARAASAEVFRADGSEDDVLARIGVDEELDAKLPLDAVFTDQEGVSVVLGDYLGALPAILVLNFYECPMLCPVTLSKLTASLNDLDALSLGKDYRVIALSFNPDETPELAAEKAEITYGMLKTPPPALRDFPFLTGGPEAIRRVTEAVGYRYEKVDEGFAHPSVVIILTPDGRVSRYLYGIEHEPRDLKLALIEASGGKVGGSDIVNQAILYCFQYDPAKDSYALVAVNAMKLGGLLTLLLVGALLAGLWLKDRSRKKIS